MKGEDDCSMTLAIIDYIFVKNCDPKLVTLPKKVFSKIYFNGLFVIIIDLLWLYAYININNFRPDTIIIRLIITSFCFDYIEITNSLIIVRTLWRVIENNRIADTSKLEELKLIVLLCSLSDYLLLQRKYYIY